MHYPIDRIVHTTPFVTPVMEHWLVCQCKAIRTLVSYDKIILFVNNVLICLVTRHADFTILWFIGIITC